MPYLTCPGCGVRQYTPPLHVRRRSCPVCDTELTRGSLLRASGDRARLVGYLEELLSDPALAERLAEEVLAAPAPAPDGAPSARAALYRQARRRALGHLDGRSTPPAHRPSTRDGRVAEDLAARPLERRAALLLRTAGDLSHREIAHVLDLDLTQARSLLAETGQVRDGRCAPAVAHPRGDRGGPASRLG